VLSARKFLDKLLVLLGDLSERVKLFLENLKTLFNSLLTKLSFPVLPLLVALLLSIGQFLYEMLFVLKLNEQQDDFRLFLFHLLHHTSVF